MGDRRFHEVCGKGDMKIDLDPNKCIKNVKYFLIFKSNLLSVDQFVREGYSLVF